LVQQCQLLTVLLQQAMHDEAAANHLRTAILGQECNLSECAAYNCCNLKRWSLTSSWSGALSLLGWPHICDNS
jgi:hypothetical protein